MKKAEIINEIIERIRSISNEVMGKYGQGIGYHWLESMESFLEKEMPGDVEDGTLAQNAAFHALLQEFYTTGLYSYAGVGSFGDLKKAVKRYLGKGFQYFVWVVKCGEDYKTILLPSKDKAPAEVVYQNGKPLVQGILYSWVDYSKTERKTMIDRLIVDMDTAGVRTAKYFEILEGMQKNSHVNWQAQDSGREQEIAWMAEKALA